MPRIVLGGDMALACRMAPHMREADRLEALRGTGHSPLEALEFSLNGTRNAFWIEHEGRPVAMAGATPVPWDANVGQPWMLGTDFITTHAHWFWRHTPEMWATVGRGYVRLWNLVDAKNAASLRWLERSGCHFLGWKLLNGHPFIKFTRACSGPHQEH